MTDAARHSRRYQTARTLVVSTLFACLACTAAPDTAPVTAAALQVETSGPAVTSVCIDCHRMVTPAIIADWRSSEHSRNDVMCSTCHGDDHTSTEDIEKASPVTAEVCGECHAERVTQFKKGKHALAWKAMKSMPSTHMKPWALIDGMQGCGGCHKIGIKDAEEIKQLRKQGMGSGLASCDACHTRHTFSAAEAREPRACATCHMGFDHAQWEMYSTSKHGIRHQLKLDGVLDESAAAPTCQTCHMAEGDHEVRTAWGFLGIRTDGLGPYPGESEEWWQDRVTILQALGVLDLQGKPTKRLDTMKTLDVARFSAEDFDHERRKMFRACSECHSERLIENEFKKGDEMIREADKLLAAAIRVVASLYKDRILTKPEGYASAFPDLLFFHDSPTVIENRLFNMHLKHRMRTFQGVFHANPDYALWYGWSEMKQDLTAIKTMAKDLRAKRRR